MLPAAALPLRDELIGTIRAGPERSAGQHRVRRSRTAQFPIPVRAQPAVPRVLRPPQRHAAHHWHALTKCLPCRLRHSSRLRSSPAIPRMRRRCSEPAARRAGPKRRGTHYLLDTSLYNASLLAGFRDFLLPDGARLPMLSAVPRRRMHPHSSLSHMAGAVVDHLGAHGSGFLASVQQGVHIESLRDALITRSVRNALLIFATSLALVHMLDALRLRARQSGYQLARASWNRRFQGCGSGVGCGRAACRLP